jgi:hypothetical protein
MDIYSLERLASFAGPAIAVGGLVYTWLTSRSTQNSVELKVALDKLVEHDRRIQNMEGELRHLPDKDGVNELKLAVVRLEGTVKALDVQLGAVGRTVANIDGYLRKEDGK